MDSHNSSNNSNGTEGIVKISIKGVATRGKNSNNNQGGGYGGNNNNNNGQNRRQQQDQGHNGPPQGQNGGQQQQTMTHCHQGIATMMCGLRQKFEREICFMDLLSLARIHISDLPMMNQQVGNRGAFFLCF